MASQTQDSWEGRCSRGSHHSAWVLCSPEGRRPPVPPMPFASYCAPAPPARGEAEPSRPTLPLSLTLQKESRLEIRKFSSSVCSVTVWTRCWTSSSILFELHFIHAFQRRHQDSLIPREVTPTGKAVIPTVWYLHTLSGSKRIYGTLILNILLVMQVSRVYWKRSIINTSKVYYCLGE